MPAVVDCKGQYELRGGTLTLCRFDDERGDYRLFVENAAGTDGPPTGGNYLWIETNDWPAWERKLVCGPYIHHCVGIHKDVVPVLYEACKYIGVAPDLYDPIEEEVKAAIYSPSGK